MSKKNKPIVLVTRPIPETGLKLLQTHCDVIMNQRMAPLRYSELLNKVKGVDAILCFLTDKIDKQIMDAAGSSLKVISTFSTGYEHLDVSEARRRGIKIGYTGDILTETTADIAIGLMLCTGRRLVEGDKYLRKGKWKYGWNPDLMIGRDLHHKTLGVIGLGKIGSAICRRAIGFGMKVLFTKRNFDPNDFKKNILFDKIEYCNLQRLVSDSDYIVISCTLNKDSYHLIDYDKIRKMKRDTYLINISRGKIIKERDLIRGLKEKLIAGAGLDVYEDEPIRSNNPLIRMQNVVLLPHIGSASIDTRNKMSEIAASNIIYVLKGRQDEAILIK
ncbi:MAG: D-glycerate dehydrogenase [Candidatus Nitrosocosmicus sp.]|nr:D-glycerate dehydrogenase [Candidatus Nitrosocosmicus sp.]MDN5867717.1 D-glycerate dehydrogenase [Candidatus Nitrosocosmicus sp.]